jgi:hypothetical protein
MMAGVQLFAVGHVSHSQDLANWAAAMLHPYEGISKVK